MYQDELIAGAPWEDHDAAGGNEIDRAGSAYIFKDPVLLGGRDVGTTNNFMVYPVPAQNTITIESVTPLSKIFLINQLGMIVKEINARGSEQYDIDISNIAEGLYFVEVYNTDGRKSSQKIIKIN